VLDRLDFPGTDPVLRRRLEDDLAELGPAALHDRLRGLDAEAAAHIEQANGRRIVRALEVVELTGGPFAARMPPPSYVYPETVQLGVDIERTVLDERITRRVDRMWADGLVEEVRRLETLGIRESRTASRALGYQQVLAFLAGEVDEEESRRRTVVGTRRFARRQDAWFRKDPRVRWVPTGTGAVAAWRTPLR